MFKWVISWLQAKLNTPKQSNLAISEYSFLQSEETPTEFIEKTVYVIGEYPWLLVLDCPCGCKDSIYLNLIEEEEPFWRFEIDEKISIFPSIWRTKGCKSHFYLIDGQIVWCD